MSPPGAGASRPRSTQVPAESEPLTPLEDMAKTFSVSDPTFYEVVKRLEFGISDWKISGPRFSDGSRPMIHIDHRLGELLIRTLLRHGEQTLSRRERDRLQNGETPQRIRLRKKITPAAVEFGDMSSSRGSTETSKKEYR